MILMTFKWLSLSHLKYIIFDTTLAVDAVYHFHNAIYKPMTFHDTNSGSINQEDCRLNSTKRPVTTMLTYPWKCTVLYCNHLGNTWKPLVLMTRHFDYCLSTSEGDNQSARSSAPVVSRCFPGGYNVKLYISS